MWEPLDIQAGIFAERSPRGKYVTLHEYRSLEQEISELKRQLEVRERQLAIAVERSEAGL